MKQSSACTTFLYISKRGCQLLICLLVLLCNGKKAFCQGALESKGTPYRSKIAEFSMLNVYDYNTASRSDEYGDADTEVERDKQFKAKLGIPLSIKEGKLIGLQLKYQSHGFLFDFEDLATDYELYNHLEDRNFTSAGLRFLYQKDIDDRRSFNLVAGGEIASDVIRLSTSTTNFFLSTGYDVKLNNSTRIGGSLFFSYSLEVPQVLPVFNLEHKLSPKWTMDISLPKRAAFRYKVTDKFYTIFKAEAKSWRYALHNSEIDGNNTTMIRKTDVQLGISFEREIHDWLWFGLDMGVAKNLRYFLAQTGDRRRDALIEAQSNDAPFLKFGIFMVPPRRYVK